MSRLMVLVDAKYDGDHCSWDCPRRSLSDTKVGSFPYCDQFDSFIEVIPSEVRGDPGRLKRLQSCRDAAAMYFRFRTSVLLFAHDLGLKVGEKIQGEEG